MTRTPPSPEHSHTMNDLTCIAIIGGGLIGGSLAEACRTHFPNIPLSLTDQAAATRSEAHTSGLFSAGVYTDPADCIPPSGHILLVIAAPISAYDTILTQLQPALLQTNASVYITDAGSVKGYTRERFRQHIPQALEHIIGAHPIAGSEHTGFTARHPKLFEGSLVILCPGHHVRPRALHVIRDFWNKISENVVNMSCEEHDMTYAAVSHLPQLVIFALARLEKERPQDVLIDNKRAFTRLYHSSPSLWSDIFYCNMSCIGTVLDQYEKALYHVVDGGDMSSPAYKTDIQESMIATPVHKRLHMPEARAADSMYGYSGAFEHAVTASLIHVAGPKKNFGGPAFADITIAAYAGICHGVIPTDQQQMKHHIGRLIYHCRHILAEVHHHGEHFEISS